MSAVNIDYLFPLSRDSCVLAFITLLPFDFHLQCYTVLKKNLINAYNLPKTGVVHTTNLQ